MVYNLGIGCILVARQLVQGAVHSVVNDSTQNFPRSTWSFSISPRYYTYTKNKRGKEPAAVTVFRNLESGIVPSETLPSLPHCNPTASLCGKKSTCDHAYYKQEPGRSEMQWLC